jgi:hypothetical protein
MSGRSKTTSQLEAIAKLPWYRGVTCKDVRDIMPTVLILLGGLLIMIFVIPYAFSSVIKQLEAEQVIILILNVTELPKNQVTLNWVHIPCSIKWLGVKRIFKSYLCIPI